MTYPPQPPDDPRYEPDPRFAPQSPPYYAPRHGPPPEQGWYGTPPPRQAQPPRQQAPRPAPRPPRRRHTGWIIAGSVFGGLLIIGAIGNALSKPAPAAKTAAASATTAAAATATAAAQPAGPSCREKVTAWRDGIGDQDFTAVHHDLNKVVSALSSENVGALDTFAARWGRDTSAAVGHPVPSCVDPGGYYSVAMADWQVAASAVQSGDYSAAATYMKRGTKYIGKSDAELVKWENAHQG